MASRSEQVLNMTAAIPLTELACAREANPFSRVCGQAMIDRVLDAVRRCKAIQTVRIVPETEAVAARAVSHGLEVVAVPSNRARPTVVWASEGIDGPSLLLCPSVPLVTLASLEQAIERFQQVAPRPVVSVERLVEEHPFKLRHLDTEGRCVDLLFGSLYYDKDAGAVIHGKTGTPTCFRQNLIPVVAITPALAILYPEDAESLESRCREGDVAWMDGEEWYNVVSPLALARAELILEQRPAL